MQFLESLKPVLLLTGILAASSATALNNDAAIPILAYHSWYHVGCTEPTNESIGLEKDLQQIHALGYTIIPAQWVAQWIIGDKDGADLPDKVVAITFDDGHNIDWIGTRSAECETKSFYQILAEFKQQNPDLPDYSPHATSFVIASPVARKHIYPDGSMSDQWWAEASESGLIDIQNHSMDHDHDSLKTKIAEPAINDPDDGGKTIFLPVGGYADDKWQGSANFMRTAQLKTAELQIYSAGIFIQSKTRQQTTLFAYPYGGYTDFLVQEYFPKHQEKHHIYAAFTTEAGYASRTSNRFKIERFVRKRDWKYASDLTELLAKAKQ